MEASFAGLAGDLQVSHQEVQPSVFVPVGDRNLGALPGGTFGALPGGLEFDAATATVSGTANATGVFHYTIEVRDGMGAVRSHEFQHVVVLDIPGDGSGQTCAQDGLLLNITAGPLGARVNLPKTLLYALNGGRDEVSGEQIAPLGEHPFDLEIDRHDSEWIKYRRPFLLGTRNGNADEGD